MDNIKDTYNASDIVKINNLTIRDNNHNTLVNNISLNIHKKEIFGLVGESGSGKTLTAKTIVDLLPKNLDYNADIMEIFKKDIKSLGEIEKRNLIGKNIGFIPQNTVFYLHPLIKIKNQIADGYIYHIKKTKKEAIERVITVLHSVGFENPKIILNYYPWQLSGGMRQRVNIAMALMNRPELIIADEPTTALDSTTQKQVVDLFKDINKNMGISILLISHDLSLVKHYSNRLAVMYAGHIVESGYTKDIFNNPKHPYTQLLIKIIPSLKMKKNEKLVEIPGFIHDTGREKQGCIFKDRCPKVMDICCKKVEEHYLGNNHYYKCNLTD